MELSIRYMGVVYRPLPCLATNDHFPSISRLFQTAPTAQSAGKNPLRFATPAPQETCIPPSSGRREGSSPERSVFGNHLRHLLVRSHHRSPKGPSPMPTAHSTRRALLLGAGAAGVTGLATSVLAGPARTSAPAIAPICRAAAPITAPAGHQAQAHLERQRHLHRRRPRRPAARPVRPARAGRGPGQFRRQHGPIARSHQHRQGGRRRRHGPALAQTAGARFRRQDHRRHPWRLHAPVRHGGIRHHDHRGPEG